MMRIVTVAALIVLQGCVETGLAPIVAPPDSEPTRAPEPPPTAATVEEFDTTTAAQRTAVAMGGQEATASLGSTVASLGNPADPGFWLSSPLVTAPVTGRVVASNGAAAEVDLRPSGGVPGSGSEASLALLRVLGLPLTGLATLEVFGPG